MTKTTQHNIAWTTQLYIYWYTTQDSLDYATVHLLKAVEFNSFFKFYTHYNFIFNFTFNDNTYIHTYIHITFWFQLLLYTLRKSYYINFYLTLYYFLPFCSDFASSYSGGSICFCLLQRVEKEATQWYAFLCTSSYKGIWKSQPGCYFKHIIVYHDIIACAFRIVKLPPPGGRIHRGILCISSDRVKKGFAPTGAIMICFFLINWYFIGFSTVFNINIVCLFLVVLSWY